MLIPSHDSEEGPYTQEIANIGAITSPRGRACRSRRQRPISLGCPSMATEEIGTRQHFKVQGSDPWPYNRPHASADAGHTTPANADLLRRLARPEVGCYVRARLPVTPLNCGFIMSKLEEALRTIVREELCNALVTPPGDRIWKKADWEIYRAVGMIPYGRVVSYTECGPHGRAPPRP